MENLSSLPPKNDTIKTPEEEAIMKQLFPQGSPPKIDNSPPPSSTSSTPQTQKPPNRINWKLLGASVLLFILLANPWVDKLFTKVPYCEEGGATVVGIKALLFSIFLILLNLYL